MTDKQIIIDNKDVSGCEYIDKDSCCNLFEGLIGTPCSSYHFRNCHYKQLKRKEQECERLKEYEKSLLNVIDDLQKTKNEWQEKYNDLGQDFDQLKRQHESDKGLITSTGKMNYQLLQEYDKMKQTLAEIKEIAKAESYLSPQSTRLLVHNILQKISEVVE